MKIDWFTIVAQLINFLVLLWLMKRFLYKPILNAIDKREKRIAGELENAHSTKVAAEKQKDEFDRKNEELKGQSSAFLKNAQDEAEGQRVRLLKEAREEADALRTKQRAVFADEVKALRTSVIQRTQEEVLAVTRKILKDLAGTSLEEHIVVVFNQKLHDLDKAEKDVLISAHKTQPGTIVVQTAFDISSEMKSLTEASIQELFGMKTKIAFESSTDLISGIELSFNGQKMAWSVADYLSTVEEGFDGLLKEQDEGKKPESEKKG